MAQGPGQGTKQIPGIGIGTVLDDRYVLDDVIATGGMGTIFRGYDKLLERTVAIKSLHPHLATTSYAERFFQEGQTIASLAHPNLVTVYDVGSIDGLPYLVMEYIDGEDLATIIERNGAMAPAAAVPLAVQICRGLGYAHDKGIVHRDVKPQNILVTGVGHVKIVDFGIARVASSLEMTEPGWVLGTAQYLAPEVAVGQQATTQSDLYSLGVVLYRLFTGQLPFDAENPLAVAMLHRTEPVPLPSSIRPGLPQLVEDVLLRLLQKEPDRRYNTASQVATALAQLDSKTPASSFAASDQEKTSVLPAGMLSHGGLNNNIGIANATQSSRRRLHTETNTTPLGKDLEKAANLWWPIKALAIVAVVAFALIWLWLQVFAAASPPIDSQASNSTADAPANAAVGATTEVTNPSTPLTLGAPSSIVREIRDSISSVAAKKLDDKFNDLAKEIERGNSKEIAKKIDEVQKEIDKMAREGKIPTAISQQMQDQIISLEKRLLEEAGSGGTGGGDGRRGDDDDD